MELILALAMVAIASAIALPLYDNFVERSRQATASGGNVQGQVRKDRNLNPINSDFDLYSMGPDGATVSALTAPRSHDDLVRARNGSFFGVAEDF